MKIHRRILTHYLSCTSPVDKEGYLYKKRGRNTSYLRRWFVLKGNLLFYQERPADRGLIGVIVLEGCVVQTGDSEVSFSLVFTGPGLRSYQLAADDQPSQRSWVNALLSASHIYISLLVRDLAQLYQEAKEGKSLCNSSTSTDSRMKMTSSVIAAFYAGSPYLGQCSAPPHRETRSYSVSHAYPGHQTHHAPSVPIRAVNKRSPKHWPKRNAHVTPLNGPAPKYGEWPLVGFDPMDEFVKLHEFYGNEVKQVRADWLKKKQQEAGHIEENLIDLG
ncbi:sesquipedalian-1 isoform X1 [Ictalurus furcatus]|uniref:sesquipedalian-1 isoform X1 n=1 Tax=Ictalurus furcatus TaxID=66913 RepID=UPI002350F12F|nr:sesquipedalian-1 isoform X1 [Ictalurus furcatus]XP_053473602.1 sesquipedalian-1 isoform X1 [Ictalurus furcatus]XP_053473610.1 sesquipedalian-1 isoform X1 [Ictalurus furcatus]XP_053473618.1 sesquipedalian-1 isoform X1 [Ictalurus furcatus]